MSARTETIKRLTKWHRQVFPGDGALRAFSAPGRTELGGNHTDHNNGKVLAAAIQLEAVAVAEPFEGRIIVYSQNWEKPFEVDLKSLELVPAEFGKTEALLRGVAYQFRERGHKWGGFRACVESGVLSGSGLSSSAAFEILTGSILNSLYNSEKVGGVEIAQIGQAAENLHFGKPCGLMDQMSSSLGGVVSIDFANTAKPKVHQLKLDLGAQGWGLFIVNTGGSHDDLTPEYAAIRSEMEAVAAYFGKKVLREVAENDFVQNLPQLRKKVSDRAVVRAFHFYGDNRRVDEMVSALEKNNLRAYFELVNESGRSSSMYLQNAYSLGSPRDQSIPLALAMTEKFLKGEGACRVHGGGFAGTIQAYVPLKRGKDYVKLMETVYGAGSVIELSIRPEPAGESK